MDRRNEPTTESEASLRINESLDFGTALQGALDPARTLIGSATG